MNPLAFFRPVGRSSTHRGLSFSQGNVPSRESIHVYYQKAMRLNMSRQASLDQLSEDDSASGSTRLRRRRRGYRMESQDSTASRDSISRYTVSQKPS